VRSSSRPSDSTSGAGRRRRAKAEHRHPGHAGQHAGCAGELSGAEHLPEQQPREQGGDKRLDPHDGRARERVGASQTGAQQPQRHGRQHSDRQRVRRGCGAAELLRQSARLQERGSGGRTHGGQAPRAAASHPAGERLHRHEEHRRQHRREQGVPHRPSFDRLLGGRPHEQRDPAQHQYEEPCASPPQRPPPEHPGGQRNPDGRDEHEQDDRCGCKPSQRLELQQSGTGEGQPSQHAESEVACVHAPLGPDEHGGRERRQQHSRHDDPHRQQGRRTRARLVGELGEHRDGAEPARRPEHGGHAS